MNIIDTIEKEGMKQNLPEIAIGDTVKVNVKVVEGTRERIQTYEGIVIARKNGGIRETIVVRRIACGVGVERSRFIRPRSTAFKSFVTAKSDAQNSIT